MKIVDDFPPNIDEITKVFKFERGTVYAYGDTIFAPGIGKGVIPDHLMVHEETHQKQQGDNPDTWWEKYLSDAKFRLTEEVEAYRNQYQFAQSHYERSYWRGLVRKMSKDLSSKMYGNIVDRATAEALIRAK